MTDNREAVYARSRKETVDVLFKLDVRPAPTEGYDHLIVDCSAVKEDDNDIEAWLIAFEDGQWHHFPADSHGTLGQVLYGIAACYTPTMQARGREARAEALRMIAGDQGPESGDSGDGSESAQMIEETP